MDERLYCVYILANKRHTVYYVGVTGNLPKRIWEHREKFVKGFTKQYNVDQLVYYEVFQHPYDAITREKEIKGWRREKKLQLIRTMNVDSRDLSGEI